MNIGYDLGRTIKGPTKDKYNEVMPDSLDVISRLTKKFNNSYIVSRVNSEQRERAINWLKDKDFYNITGIPEENVYYCFDRRDKALFVEGLRINVFIDDRPSVLCHMNKNVKKILFNPSEADLVAQATMVADHDMIIVRNWKEVEQIL